MHRFVATLICSALVASTAMAADPLFIFRNVAEEAGIMPAAAYNMGHGAGWGDIDNDGWNDLYLATFHAAEGTKPNMLFRNREGKFTMEDQPAVQVSARSTGVVFADFDNDGDLDLYLGSMYVDPGSRIEEGMIKAVGEQPFVGCQMFSNDGKGKFTNVSKANGACPLNFGGRSAAVLDYDGDGLLDLLVGEDPFPTYNGSPTRTSRMFHNMGKMRFEDVTQAVGIPENSAGLGVAVADVNNDTLPDFFVRSTSKTYYQDPDSPRWRGKTPTVEPPRQVLFVNNGDGTFREPPGSRELFHWFDCGGDNMICGVCFGDVNNDGRQDIVLGQHYSRPWTVPVANRLYLNRGNGGTGGNVLFEDVTAAVGMVPLFSKAPHVEVQDFDNDGLPDIYTNVVIFDQKDKNIAYPVIYKNLGMKDGLPRFREDALGRTDFPSEADKAVVSSAENYDKMIAQEKYTYAAPGPTCDFDNDGKLDIFLPNWWVEGPARLLRNETKSGNWLQIEIDAPEGVNKRGIGSRINLYPAGTYGTKESARLVGREVACGFGYASGQPPITHFGLGDAEAVDIEIILPHHKGTLVHKDVKANQRITLGPE